MEKELQRLREAYLQGSCLTSEIYVLLNQPGFEDEQADLCGIAGDRLSDAGYPELGTLCVLASKNWSLLTSLKGPKRLILNQITVE